MLVHPTTNIKKNSLGGRHELVSTCLSSPPVCASAKGLPFLKPDAPYHKELFLLCIKPTALPVLLYPTHCNTKPASIVMSLPSGSLTSPTLGHWTYVFRYKCLVSFFPPKDTVRVVNATPGSLLPSNFELNPDTHSLRVSSETASYQEVTPPHHFQRTPLWPGDTAPAAAECTRLIQKQRML